MDPNAPNFTSRGLFKQLRLTWLIVVVIAGFATLLGYTAVSDYHDFFVDHTVCSGRQGDCFTVLPSSRIYKSERNITLSSVIFNGVGAVVMLSILGAIAYNTERAKRAKPQL